MARTFRTLDELQSAVGEPLGRSDWLLVDQQRIDAFAAATGDQQWIHVDPDRSAAGPFGGTVAHGYLTLALLPVLVGSVVDYAGWSVKVNYGSNKVRFPRPVPAGGRVRAAVTLGDVRPTAAGVQVTLQVSVELADPAGAAADKPALVAETLTLLAAPTAP